MDLSDIDPRRVLRPRYRGVAYDASLVASGQGAIRIWNSGTALITQRVNATSRYVLAAAASLPLTVTIQNDFHTDFNDDGHADFLWQRQTTGALSLWFMQGTTALSANSFNPNGVADPHWKVIGSADFDRDGYPDLLWWHDQLGTFGVWFMKGTTLRERAMLNPSGFADTSWKVVALADFDGDGYPDLLWRHDVTGAFGVWLMQGTDLKARVMLNPTGIADTSWKVVGVGDFDGDGHPVSCVAQRAHRSSGRVAHERNQSARNRDVEPFRGCRHELDDRRGRRCGRRRTAGYRLALQTDRRRRRLVDEWRQREIRESP